MATDGIIAPDHKSNNLKIAFGQHTTVTANDAIVSGLKNIVRVVVIAEDDPVAGAQHYTAVPGTSGNFNVKGWKATATADTALIAATTFSKKVNWVAFGY